MSAAGRGAPGAGPREPGRAGRPGTGSCGGERGAGGRAPGIWARRAAGDRAAGPLSSVAGRGADLSAARAASGAAFVWNSESPRAGGVVGAAGESPSPRQPCCSPAPPPPRSGPFLPEPGAPLSRVPFPSPSPPTRRFPLLPRAPYPGPGSGGPSWRPLSDPRPAGRGEPPARARVDARLSRAPLRRVPGGAALRVREGAGGAGFQAGVRSGPVPALVSSCCAAAWPWGPGAPVGTARPPPRSPGDPARDAAESPEACSDAPLIRKFQTRKRQSAIQAPTALGGPQPPFWMPKIVSTLL